MVSQWDHFLQHVGNWEGSFARYDATGTWQSEIPTLVSIEPFQSENGNSSMRLTVRRYQPEIQESVFEYSSLGNSVFFFDSGPFSQGSVQWSPYSQFGAEFGFISGERRLRLVELFNRDSQPDQFSLIRERLSNSDASESPPLTVDDLVGKWRGEAVTYFPNSQQPPQTYTSELQVSQTGDGEISQVLNFRDRQIVSKGKLGNGTIDFTESTPTVRVLLLPGGASATFPLQIEARQPFFLEAGWLLSPTQRQRLIRRYNQQGEWESLTLVVEEKE